MPNSSVQPQLKNASVYACNFTRPIRFSKRATHTRTGVWSDATNLVCHPLQSRQALSPRACAVMLAALPGWVGASSGRGAAAPIIGGERSVAANIETGKGKENENKPA